MLWSSLRRVQAIDPCKALFENNNCRLIAKLSICRLVLNSRVTVKDRLRCAALLPKYVPSEISLKRFRMDNLGKVCLSLTQSFLFWNQCLFYLGYIPMKYSKSVIYTSISWERTSYLQRIFSIYVLKQQIKLQKQQTRTFLKSVILKSDY